MCVCVCFVFFLHPEAEHASFSQGVIPGTVSLCGILIAQHSPFDFSLTKICLTSFPPRIPWKTSNITILDHLSLSCNPPHLEQAQKDYVRVYSCGAQS